MKLFSVLIFVNYFFLAVSKQLSVEDVSAKQLEAAKDTEKNLAVLWYSKNCKTCDRVLDTLERIKDDLVDEEITLLSINDKKQAKNYNIRNFPTISFFRSGSQILYEGDLLNTNSILSFFTNFTESSDLVVPHVTVEEIDELVATNKYVAVFFYSVEKVKSFEKYTDLKQIMHVFSIRLVSSSDIALVSEYNLSFLPALVFYRDEIPLLFEGNVENESDILEWLTQNRHSGDKNTNQIEEISTKNLDIVTSTLQRVLVFQYGSESAENQFTMSILEKLDDRCSFRSIHFVQHKVHEFDTKLILYRNNIPIVFKGNLKEEAAIEEWINTQIKNNEKKKAYDLMSFINESKNLLVIFCKYTAYGIIALTHTCFLLKNFTSHEYKNVLPKEKLKGLASEM